MSLKTPDRLLVELITQMLQLRPNERPKAGEVETRMWFIAITTASQQIQELYSLFWLLVALRVATLLLQVAQKVVVDWYDIQKRRNPMVQETVDILYPILCPYTPMTHPFYGIPSMTFLLCTRQRAFIIQSLNYHPNCPLFPLSKHWQLRRSPQAFTEQERFKG